MKKMILALCAVATLSVAIISCSKKEDSDDTTTTTTTSTTSTTSTTTPIDTTTRPTATKNTLVIDTNIVGYTVTTCGAIAQGRWALTGAKSSDMNKAFNATFGSLKGFNASYTITPTLPATGSQSVMISVQLDSGFFTASSGTVMLTNDTAGKNLTFKDIKFTKTGQPDILINANLQCP
ncbi:MAG: hypothetical protein V4590_04310 [Bacteroidota bacterium]